MDTVLISGSSRGLGASLAKKFSAENFFYYGLSRWNDTDVTNFEEINDYVKRIQKNDFPKILINNAGVCETGSLLDIELDNAKEIFDTNFFGLVNLTQIFVKKCIQYNINDCKIINIASTAGTGARSGRSIYAASKAAVISFSSSMSKELKEYGIKVFCICPGAFDSDMRRKIEPNDNFEIMLKPEIVADKIYEIIKLNLDNQMVFIR